MATDMSVDEWAKLLETRVLRPDEFDGICVSSTTHGWGYLDTATIDPTKLTSLLQRTRARGQVVIGILPASSDYPIRVILKGVPVSGPSAERPKRQRHLRREVDSPAAGN
jgi:hypothetical protein